jgi:uncharacterized membrane protein
MTSTSPGGAALARDYGIDALRGLAIIAMVASHLARDLLVDPHPLWLRMYGSLAAPLFITLAGMLVAQTAARKRHPLGYYIQRGLIILCMAAALDVLLWGIYPLVGVDVLYLIGVAVPLTALFGRLSSAWQTFLLVAILGLAALCRQLTGYSEQVLAFPLTDSPLDVVEQWGAILHQWFVSGWFPMFPWLFFSFLGVRLYQWRQAGTARFVPHVLRVSAGLTAAGAAAAWFVPPRTMLRGGYSELFYPPTIVYVLLASAVVLVLFAAACGNWMARMRALVTLVQCSLLMYLVHLVLIHTVLLPLLDEVELPMFMIVYTALVLVLVGMAEMVELYKRRSERRLPFMLRFLLGS